MNKTTVLAYAMLGCWMSLPQTLHATQQNDAATPAHHDERTLITPVLNTEGTLIASCCDQGIVLVHEVATGKLLTSLQLPTSTEALAFNPDSTLVAVGAEGNILVVNPFSQLIVQELPSLEQGATVHTIEWSPNGKHLLIAYTSPRQDAKEMPAGKQGSKLERLRVLELSTGKTIYKRVLTGFAQKPTFTPDGKGVLMVTPQQSLIRMNLNTKRYSTLAKEVNASSAIVWRPDRSLYAVEGAQGGVKVLDLNGDTRYEYKDAEGIAKMIWSGDGRILLVGEGHQGANHQYVIDFEAQKPLDQVTNMLSDQSSCTLSPDGRYLAYMNDKIIYLLDIKKASFVLKAHCSKELPRLFFTPDSSQLYFFDSSGYGLERLSLTQ